MQKMRDLNSILKNILGQVEIKQLLIQGKSQHQHIPSTPEVTGLNDLLTGTAEPKTWVIISVGETFTRVKVDKQGHWQIENPLKEGGVVTIYAANHHGLRSEAIMIAPIAEPIVLPKMPEILEKGEYLIGKAEAGNTVVVTYGEQEFITVADENGDWSMLNPLTTTGAISVVVIDQDGHRSDALHTAQIILPQAVTILESGAVISGTAAPNTTVVIESDQAVYRIQVDENGDWSIENPVANGGTLMIVVEDQFGQQSPAIGLAFPFIQTPPENPSYVLPAPEVTLNSEKLEGNVFQQAKIIVTANGQEYVTYANESGFWSMDNPIQNGGFATIVAEDSRGVQSPEISIAKLILAQPESSAELTEILLVSDELSDEQTENQNDSQIEPIQSVINLDTLLQDANEVPIVLHTDEQDLIALGSDVSNPPAILPALEYPSLLIEAPLTPSDWLA